MAKTGPIALALLSLACTATDAPADGRPGAGGTEASSEPAVDPSAEQPPDGGGGEQRFFDWTTLATSPGAGRLRRGWLADEITSAGGGVFLAPGRPARSRGETFRQTDDFLYLTGLELPDAVVAVDAEARTAVVFAPARDERFESETRPNDFPGRPLADDPELSRVAGLPIRPIEDLDRALAAWAGDGRDLWIDVGPGEAGATVRSPKTAWVRDYSPEDVLVMHLAAKYPHVRIRNAHAAVARLRTIKSEAEIAVLRRACRVTTESIRHAARLIAPGVDERTLAAELEAEFARRGSPRPAFDSIVKSGPNSLWPWRVLAAHYERRNRTMQAGELVIFDVGCELAGYASDVGRTFPVSGRFTPRQREVLEREVAVADAILAAVRPGATFAELTEVARAAMTDDMRPHMQTGLFFGHHVGLSVGDPSLPDAPLEPGMVFTVEPWYYDHDEGLAVFTEDVVVVTPDGCEVLTADLPRTPDALERLMR